MADKSLIAGSSRMESVQKTSKGTRDKSFFEEDFTRLPADVLAAIKDLPFKERQGKGNGNLTIITFFLTGSSLPQQRLRIKQVFLF